MTRRSRLAVELGYVAVAWGSLALSPVTLWAYLLFVLITLPTSLYTFGIASMGWGGLFAGSGQGRFFAGVIVASTPFAQIALGRMVVAFPAGPTTRPEGPPGAEES